MKNKHLLILFAILLLTGCSNEILFLKKTPTPQILADCFVTFYPYAWVDSNANGTLDDGELPLQNVEFAVDGMYAYSAAKGRGISDEDGNARIDTWTPGECPEKFTVRATLPDGYLLTTDDTQVFFGEQITISPTVLFGFQLIE
ncbi:MAG: hypothetical protein Q7J07_04975 [Pelolinea sp.]|nr:hypothetical protein [Pelolinea sp.]